MKPVEKLSYVPRAPEQSRGGGVIVTAAGEPQFLSVNDLDAPKGDRVPDWLVAAYARMGSARPEALSR